MSVRTKSPPAILTISRPTPHSHCATNRHHMHYIFNMAPYICSASSLRSALHWSVQPVSIFRYVTPQNDPTLTQCCTFNCALSHRCQSTVAQFCSKQPAFPLQHGSTCYDVTLSKLCPHNTDTTAHNYITTHSRHSEQVTHALTVFTVFIYRAVEIKNRKFASCYGIQKQL